MYEYNPMTAFGWMMEELGINDENTSTVSIYPNPTDNFAKVVWDDITPINYGILYNQYGVIVGKYNAEGNSMTVERNDNAAGQYFLTLFDENDNLVLTDKIILK
jgi:hypothetical protein